MAQQIMDVGTGRVVQEARALQFSQIECKMPLHSLQSCPFLLVRVPLMMCAPLHFLKDFYVPAANSVQSIMWQYVHKVIQKDSSDVCFVPKWKYSPTGHTQF